jgi:LPXTG-motif cell wall-anchored protein
MNKFIVTCAGLLASGGAYAHEAAHLDPVSHTLAHTGDSAVLALALGAAIVTALAALLRTVKNNSPRR